MRRRPYHLTGAELQTTKIAEYERINIMEVIEGLLKRRFLTVKKLTPAEEIRLYEEAITPAEHEALRVLCADPDWKLAINHSRSVVLCLKNEEAPLAMPTEPLYDKGPVGFIEQVRYEFTFPKNQYFPTPRYQSTSGIQLLHVHPSPELLRRLWDVALSYVFIEKQNERAHMAARAVLYDCNTWGQVMRLWPELNTFLPKAKRNKVEDQKRASPLPKGVSVEETRHRLTRLVNPCLTQAMLMPDTIDARGYVHDMDRTFSKTVAIVRIPRT